MMEVSDKSRWVEIAITITVSAVTSAVAVAWSIATSLSDFRSKLAELGRNEIELAAQIRIIDAHQDEAGIRIAVQEAHYADILSRLNEMAAYIKVRK